jgi:hypothetical protein
MLKAGTAARRRSLEWEIPRDAATVRQGVESFLHALDRRLQEHDPTWVGHCKVLLTSEGGSAYASMTGAGETARWAGAPVEARAAEATIYVALYNWSDQDVAQALDSVLADAPFLEANVPSA